VYIVDSKEKPNLNSGRPPSTHFTSDDDNDCMQQYNNKLIPSLENTAYCLRCYSV